ncbi:MAG: hypothetical protein HYY80_03710 [Chloroflexi bacterium]|nr:hypothetical protein [Chloroflexota bacterium]
MKTLQFLIDNICADFTLNSLLSLVRTCLAREPATISDITRAIIQRDRSLDIRCAEGLAEGAVLALSESGEVEVRDSRIYATGQQQLPEGGR